MDNFRKIKIKREFNFGAQKLAEDTLAHSFQTLTQFKV